MRLFRCHQGFTFGGSTLFPSVPDPNAEYLNTGRLYNLSGKFSYPVENLGLYESTHDPDDVARLRSQRSASCPLMHNGSIASLNGVLDHYAAGGRTIASGALAADGSKNLNRVSWLNGFNLTAEQR
jgi:cytochrome c peroxidase